MVDTGDGHPPQDDPPLFRTWVAAPLAPMHSEPLVTSQQVSQQLAGHDIDAMDVDGDWVRGRGEDGYEGWMHIAFLEPLGGQVIRARPRQVSLGCKVKRSCAARR